jgi:hypothetical protein
MVLSLCRSPGGGYALKFAVTAPGRVEALLYGVRESRSNSVEGMAYMRENWAPVCNEVRFREDRSEGGEGKSREWQPDSPLMLWVTSEEKSAIRASGRKGGRPFLPAACK